MTKKELLERYDGLDKEDLERVLDTMYDGLVDEIIKNVEYHGFTIRGKGLGIGMKMLKDIFKQVKKGWVHDTEDTAKVVNDMKPVDTPAMAENKINLKDFFR
jgi:ribose 5-phosphate isomerase RpiB